MVRPRDGEAPDVERLPGAPVLGDPVDAAEVQRLVPDVELLQAGQAGPDHDVALGPGLEGAAPAQIEDAVEHVARLAPHELQAVVGAVEVLLLRLQLGMFGHRSPSSPRPASCCRVPSGKRSSLERDGPGPGLAPRDPGGAADPGRGWSRLTMSGPCASTRPPSTWATPGRTSAGPGSAPTGPRSSSSRSGEHRTRPRSGCGRRRGRGHGRPAWRTGAGAGVTGTGDTRPRPRLLRPAGVPHPGVVHAPGRAGAPRVPGGPWQRLHPLGHLGRAAGGGADAATGPALRGGRGDPVLGHRGPAPRRRLRRRDRSGPWTGRGAALP